MFLGEPRKQVQMQLMVAVHRAIGKTEESISFAWDERTLRPSDFVDVWHCRYAAA